MNVFGKIAAVAALCVALGGVPASAHHSFAMFDQTKVTMLKNVTVVEFRWGNPHAFLVVSANGQRYARECSSPSALTSSGWKFNTVKSGDKIDVVIYPLRNGKAGGALKSATLPNGQSLVGV